MRELKATPGPWVARYCGEGAIDGEAVDAWTVDGPFIVDTEDCGMLDKANAHLIAAAPDLYAACEAAAAHHQGFHSDVGRLIRSALAKALGSK